MEETQIRMTRVNCIRYNIYPNPQRRHENENKNTLLFLQMGSSSHHMFQYYKNGQFVLMIEVPHGTSMT